MNQKSLLQTIAAMTLLIVAGWLVFRAWHGTGEQGERVYFYDVSEQKLFPAPRAAVPPIRGINNADEDGVRAIVVSPTGDPRDRKQRRIAYLEKYSPQLKQMFEAVRRAEAAGESTAGVLGRGAVPANTLVRRVNEQAWHLMTSAEGEKIVNEWNVPSPDGKYPAVCVP
jgi:hypothetical protein